MLGLDQNGGYVLSAFGITVVVLAGYALYLRSRLTALRRRRLGQSESLSTTNETRPASHDVSSSSTGASAPEVAARGS